MKTTRTLTIKDRVFSLDDLQRLASAIGAEHAAARMADEHSNASYTFDFADETRIEVDDPSVVSQELLARPARAVTIEFQFHNYSKGRSIHFSLHHGNYPWGSSLRIVGQDRAWVDAQFFSFKEVIETAKPQVSAPRRYKNVILHASALGIGTLAQMTIDLFLVTMVVSLGVLDGIEPLGEDSQLRTAIVSLGPILYALLWMWRWALGLLWGAFAVRAWLLELWPSVEFAFGPEHHRVEAQRRRRLAAVVSLVAVPLSIAIAYDLVRYAF